MTSPEMPTELLVIGSGAIGIEFASFYADLGAKVTMVEMLDRVLPVEDAEVSDQLAKSLTEAGPDDPHRRGRRQPQARPEGSAATMKRGDWKSVEHRFSHAIVAIGIVPNTKTKGLEAFGVKTDQGRHRHGRLRPHECRGRFGHRRRHRAAVAGAQGDATRRIACG